ncbi:MAG TPA: twin-arginine translocase subunit TatC [Gammaproteobacteria bacterium]|nr:twin-arginine translocase subunit TatC [Gammaproteobacteria bacterium]
MTEQESPKTVDGEMSFITHLLELRDRLLRMVLSIIIIFAVLYFYSSELFSYISGPLLKYMPKGSQMSAVDVASPFLTPFKLSIVASMFLAMPYILYQLWGFVAPGLYQKERRMAAPLVVVSSALFYIGMAFAYYVVFPLVFVFLAGQALEGVAYIPDITRYLDFVLTLLFAFGVAFQVPIATILVVWTGMVSPKQLTEKRPYVIVGAFVIGMLLTPPDFISQTLLAVPMWLLFELGIVFSRFYVPNRDEDEDEDEENTIAATATSSPVTGGDSEEVTSNDTGHEEYEPVDINDFRPMTNEEMDAEMDRIDAEMDAMDAEDDDQTPEPEDTRKDE